MSKALDYTVVPRRNAAGHDEASWPGSMIPRGVGTELLTSGISVSCANTATNPLDVVKVRLQIESNKVRIAGQAKPGLVKTGLNVVKHEGVTALWSGLGPSLARGFFFGGARLGMYTPIKNILIGDEKPTFAMKVAAGSISGGVAAAITSPIELIKTRLQCAGNNPAKPKTSMGVIKAVVAADGVVGLWKGAMPGLIRAAILTAAQCATYDEIKRKVVNLTGWNEKNLATQVTSSMLAGLATTTVSNPIDVVKTRMYVSGGQYSGAMACLADVVRKDGMMGLMKGWSASYARLGPHTMIMFLTAEQLRAYAGLQSL